VSWRRNTAILFLSRRSNCTRSFFLAQTTVPLCACWTFTPGFTNHAGLDARIPYPVYAHTRSLLHGHIHSYMDHSLILMIDAKAPVSPDLSYCTNAGSFAAAVGSGREPLSSYGVGSIRDTKKLFFPLSLSDYTLHSFSVKAAFSFFFLDSDAAFWFLSYHFLGLMFGGGVVSCCVNCTNCLYVYVLYVLYL